MADFKLGLYQHYKGDLYCATGLAKHHESRQWMVLYVSLKTGTTNVRELNDPNADSWLQCVKVDGKEVPRFRYIGMPSDKQAAP